ncbi:FecCD family ABC transporter permease [Comamonas serinivorans]|uniref:FecCD family ABC transporter permease n=1 Tax=Comamonas serinivorans TaxID=1082851 RepID=UPI001F21C3F4|nr:iron ABC transporter permease [Comamonas serinivorans]
MLLLALAVLLLAAGAALCWGSSAVPASQVWEVLRTEALHALGLPAVSEASPQHQRVVWLIRMPRVLLAAVVGAGLAVVGVAMQALVRNPLADPYLLGVSSGASVGAVSVLAWGALASAGLFAITLGAFAGALLATTLVYLLALQQGRVLPTRLILSGVAVAYTCMGVTSLITLTAGQRELAASLMTWTLGSLSGSQWISLPAPALILLLGLAVLWGSARELNVLRSGDESAISLGLNVARFRRRMFVLVSLMTGSLVAVSGAIGFVGLVIPHITRMLIGHDHRRVLPVAALMGAAFLIAVDLLARTAFAPMELPVGVITSLIGGPFFIGMLVRQGRQTRRADKGGPAC